MSRRVWNNPRMARHLRVFVSSTMEDLGPERDAVSRKLRSDNYEPVLAEDLLPTGDDSWTTISKAIRDSDLLVLILGPSYGWIPQSGPHGGRGMSITELEVRHAREHKKIVIPFIQRIEGDEDPRRAKFRKWIEDWNGGYFRTTFKGPRDLAGKVARAVTAVLTDSFLKSRFEQSLSLEGPVAHPVGRAMSLPPELLRVVESRSAIGLIGAGVSLAAGLPAAQAFTEEIVRRILEVEPHYAGSSPAAVPFYAAATDLKLLCGTDALYQLAAGLVDPPFLRGTSPLHVAATEAFDLVLTTNYDAMLESADPARRVLFDDTLPADLSEPVIVKLAGTIRAPESMVLTELDLASVYRTKASLRQAVVRELQHRPLVAIGTSLRDPSIVSLLESVGTPPNGWAVGPSWSTSDTRRLRHWNLEPLEADAASFFASVAAGRAPR